MKKSTLAADLSFLETFKWFGGLIIPKVIFLTAKSGSKSHFFLLLLLVLVLVVVVGTYSVFSFVLSDRLNLCRNLFERCQGAKILISQSSEVRF